MKTVPQSAVKKLLAPLALGLLLPVSVGSCQGCKKDEPPPPLPSAAPVTTASAPVLEFAPEDAAIDVVDAAEDPDAKPKGTGRPAGNLQACCNALQQNAMSAPPPTNTYMLQAAAACSAAAAAGKDKASAVGAIAGALKGAGMPASCR